MSRRKFGATEETPIPPGANKGGRPTQLTPELLEKMLQPLHIGARVQTAAALNNIGYDTLRAWVLKGHEDPESLYGELIRRVTQAIATWELRDISVLDKHAMGAPAQYEREVVRDKDGSIIMGTDGKPLMQIARDDDGKPILKTSEIKSDWRAAAHRLASRLPKYWNKEDNIDHDAVLTFDAKEREIKPIEARTFDQKIADAVKKLEEEY